MKQFRTATLSHEDIRMALSKANALSGGYTDGYGWILDCWDTYCVFCTFDLDDKKHLYKQSYKITGEDDVQLDGEPVEVAHAFVKKGTTTVVASKMVAGLAANKLLANLKSSNALIARLDGTANTHLVVIDLTTIGLASQHQGQTKYLLEKSGLQAAADTLISKPVHVNQKFDGHVDAGANPVAIGTFLGSVPIENEDGTVTFRTVATLWKGDFPDIVEDIQVNASKLGASYEIAYDPETTERKANVLHIKNYEFSGGAILLQSAAAHPETRMVHATAIETDELILDGLTDAERAAMPDEEYGYVDAEVRRFPMRTLAQRTHWGSLFAQLLGEPLEGGTLTTKQRNELPASDFALPDERRFPIHDEAHRKNAWARVETADLTDAEKSTVRDKIMARAKREKDTWAQAYSKSGGKWVKAKSALAGLDPHELAAVFDRIKARAIQARDPWVAKLAPPFTKKDAPDDKDKAKKKGGGQMPKYAGIDDATIEALVDGIVANAVTAAEIPLKAAVKTGEEALAAKVAELDTTKASLVESGNKVAELTVAAAALTTERDTLKASLAGYETVKAEAEEKTALDAEWTKIKAMWGLDDKQRAEREPLLKKLVAKKEPLSVEEMQQLTAGGKGTNVVPLFAGSRDGGAAVTPDESALKTTFPAALIAGRKLF